MLCFILIGSLGAQAFTEADLVGFWSGTAEGPVLPEKIGVTLDLWIEDSKLTGMIGHEFGVSKLDSITLADDLLTFTFFNPHLGAGAISGKITPQKTCDYKWSLGDAEGTGRVAWQDPNLTEEIAPGKLAGAYLGMASSPLLPDEFPLGIKIESGEGTIKGTIETPIGSYDITTGIRRRNRLQLQGRSMDEDTGIIVATIKDDRLEIYWTGGGLSGRATLMKRGVSLPAEAIVEKI